MDINQEIDEEPLAKRPQTASATTDYKFCLYCQIHTDEKLNKPMDGSYKKFLSDVHSRAELGNIDFIPVSQRLNNVDEQGLITNKAHWHSSCYRMVTHKILKERDVRRYNQACELQDTSGIAKRKRGRPQNQVLGICRIHKHFAILPGRSV